MLCNILTTERDEVLRCSVMHAPYIYIPPSSPDYQVILFALLFLIDVYYICIK